MAGPQRTPQLDSQRDAFFDRIVHQHARLLYRVAHSVLRNPADAEDAVADAVLKLIRTGAWQTITNERAFLARTVWRTALDRLETRIPVAAEAPETLLRHLEDLGPSPEHNAANAEKHTLLHTLIDQLPIELRNPLLLSAVDELNSREIGELLNLPEGTVRTRLMRARQQLRAEFEALHTATVSVSPRRKVTTVGARSEP